MNETIGSTVIINNQTSLNVNDNKDDKSSTYYIKERLKYDAIDDPLSELKSQVFPLERELFSCFNLQWGVDIISEDIPLIDEDHQNYYLHLIRTANPDPQKENFFLIHGFLSSGLHFICLVPFLIKRYNIFIPDTVGMGLSSRPKIKFTSPFQCENYFLSIYHIIIKSIFFKGRFNIKKEYYLCGHSLGGFIASRYSLKYPQGIKKLLLLSPAGITNYRKPGTIMSRNISCYMYCLSVLCPSCVWPCKVRVQSLYRCCCCHECIKKNYGTYYFNIDGSEIKNNPDGSTFMVDVNKISLILRKLAILSLDYPDDLYKCAYYLFGNPPPAAYLPIEDLLQKFNNIPTIFVFGENDWMDREGAYRLFFSDQNKYKVFTIRTGGHSFAMTNPKELSLIIDQYFPY